MFNYFTNKKGLKTYILGSVKRHQQKAFAYNYLAGLDVFESQMLKTSIFLIGLELCQRVNGNFYSNSLSSRLGVLRIILEQC